MTDNGGAYRSTVHAIACRALGIRHIRTRPYGPAPSGWLEFYNWSRPHEQASSRGDWD